MQNLTPQYQKGFTLLEIILTLAIGAMLTLIAATCFGVLFEAQGRLSGERELREQGLQVLRLMTRAVKNADAVSTTPNGDILLTITPFGQITPDTIALHDETLWLSEAGGPEIALTNSKVQVKEFAATNYAVNNAPVSIEFTLRLEMPIGLLAQNKTIDLTLHTSTTMRSEIP